ncbi:FAD/NAD(P)-binding oxidoreductase, partial [uncultured Anaerovibrio sp.]|uniref:NAD(P)/FAD-dependent oxidoreductase n=1 Tax=uncultured Anaerovibrio sp. TaxID=361586 RepID=UPI0025F65C5E
MKKYLIVGGVAGGATAAARLRRLDETARIILFERGEDISFANCGLPYYVGGTIEERDDLLVMNPRSFNNLFNVEVRNHSEVIAVAPDRKMVTVRSTEGEYEEEYDALLLA